MTTQISLTTALDEIASLFEYPWEKPVIQNPENRKALSKLIDFINTSSVEEIQDLYTKTFDLSPDSPPYLGFHLHGESYRRGTMMAKLRTLFQRHGVPECGELPDHIAPITRLLAIAPSDPDMVEMIREEVYPGMEKLLSGMSDRANPYLAPLQIIARSMQEYMK